MSTPFFANGSISMHYPPPSSPLSTLLMSALQLGTLCNILFLKRGEGPGTTPTTRVRCGGSASPYSIALARESTHLWAVPLCIGKKNGKRDFEGFSVSLRRNPKVKKLANWRWRECSLRSGSGARVTYRNETFWPYKKWTRT